MPKRDLISMEDLSRGDIELLLDTAESFLPVLERDIKKVPTLRGRTIINLFWEPSPRTSSSYDLAAKRLSADTLVFRGTGTGAGVNVERGEALKDTAITMDAYSPDIIIMRHPSAGACRTLSANTTASVINAGDGMHQDPTQCLLDLFALRQAFGRELKDLKVFIVGDILHSRVARSDVMGFRMLGMDVTLVAPPTLMPRGIEQMGVTVEYDLTNLKDADVVYVLRMDAERAEPGSAYLPSLREYAALWGVSRARLRPGQRVMHPGPINRGAEITADVADDDENLIAHQVFSGLAVRMAVLYRTTVGYSDTSAEEEVL
ncbi:MAG TPA: aspartate carbamoyltransferase catalytic subunit [Thermoleophilia bacterium]|nr:aspartate carbamoyltransferase catalytic subunit [Thermoleophilia bacterium]